MYQRCSKEWTVGEKENKEKREEVHCYSKPAPPPTSDIIHYSSTLNKLEGQTLASIYTVRCAVQMAG